MADSKLQAVTTKDNERESSKKKILSALEYDQICEFINNFHGLAIDCEQELLKLYGAFYDQALKSILQTELGSRLRSQYWRYEAKAPAFLKIFNQQSAETTDTTLLLKMAIVEGMSPIVLCRSLLQEKYKFQFKSQLTHLMKWPHLIDDPRLAANVRQCVMSDNQDGPLADIKRRALGEEYEFKLKTLAKSSGMHYYDENDLRRMGFDKTPDLKLILPCLYKGEVVNWIESKAVFGDVRTHKYYVSQQLNSYCNRFGPGIIIYWFGYHEQTPQLSVNSSGITVLADFPEINDLTLMDLSSKNSTDKLNGIQSGNEWRDEKDET